jgi:hypothetical protein
LEQLSHLCSTPRFLPEPMGMGLTSEGDVEWRMLLPSLRGTAWAPAEELGALGVPVRAGGELERDKDARESAGGLACSIAGLYHEI